jgi:hypothetical protein
MSASEAKAAIIGDRCHVAEWPGAVVTSIGRWCSPQLLDWCLQTKAFQERLRIKSAPFSAIIIVGAFVLPLTIDGMIEASQMLRPSIP